MPIPKPLFNEEKKRFIARCMGNHTMRTEFPDQKKRAGVCYTQWRDRKKEKETVKKETVRVGNERKEVVMLRNFKALDCLKKDTPENKEFLKGESKNKEVNMNANKVLKEAFKSLQSALRKAIEVQPGKNYLVDFSTKEVVFSKYSEDSEEEYFKVKYVIKHGEVELDGSPERVERKTTFEDEVKTNDLIGFAEMEKQLEE